MGKLRVYCLKTLKNLSIYPLGNTPSAPSVGDVALEHSGGVRPSHGEYGEVECAERGVEHGHVARCWVKLALVEGDIEVEGGIDRSPSEIFSDDVGVGGHRSVLDGDCVQRL